MTIKRTCPQCQIEFETSEPSQKYCKPEHRMTAVPSKMPAVECSPANMPDTPKATEEYVKLALIEFYGDPTDQRSLEKVAEDLNISKNRIYDVKKKYKQEIMSAASDKLKKNMDEMRLRGFKALNARLQGKSQKPIELLFRLTGDLIERVEQTNKFETPEKKREKISDMLKSLGLSIAPAAQVPVSPAKDQLNTDSKSNA